MSSSAAYIVGRVRVKVVAHWEDELGAANTIQTDPGAPQSGVTVSLTTKGQGEDDAGNPISAPVAIVGPLTTQDDGASAWQTVQIAKGQYPVDPTGLLDYVGPDVDGITYRDLPYQAAGMVEGFWESNPGSSTRTPLYGFAGAGSHTGIGAGNTAVGVVLSGLDPTLSIPTEATSPYSAGVFAAANWQPYQQEGSDSNQYWIDLFAGSGGLWWTGVMPSVGNGVFVETLFDFPNGQPYMPELVEIDDGNGVGPPPALNDTGTSVNISPWLNRPTGFHLHDCTVVVHIIVPRPTAPTVPAALTGATQQHYVRGAISLPEGGGSPKLYVVSSQQRWTFKQMYRLQVDRTHFVPQYTLFADFDYRADYTDLRASVSTDGGVTWSPAVDVGVHRMAYADANNNWHDSGAGSNLCADGGHAEWTGSAAPGVFSGSFSGSAPVAVVPMSIIPASNGKLFVMATLSTPMPFPPGRWQSPAGISTGAPASAGFSYAPRICEVVTLANRDPATGALSSAFRDGATIWADIDSDPADDIGVLGISALAMSGGNVQGSRGLGGQSLGPCSIYGWNSINTHTVVSADGGDTWEASPVQIKQAAPSFVDSNYSTFGVFWLGRTNADINFSGSPSVPTPYYEGAGSVAVGPLPQTYPGDTSSFVTSNPATGALYYSHKPIGRQQLASMQALGSIAPYSYVRAIQTNEPLFWHWGAHIALMVASGGVMRTWTSDDNGKTFTQRQVSRDNCKTWQPFS